MGFKSWFTRSSTNSGSTSSNTLATLTLNDVTLTANGATLVVNNGPTNPAPKKKKTYKRENYGTIDKVPEEVMTKVIEAHKKMIKVSYEKYGTTRRNLPTVDMAEEELNEAIIYNDKYAYIAQNGYWVSAWAAKSDRVEEELIKFCNELFTYTETDTSDPALTRVSQRRHPYILNYRQGHVIGYEILFVKNL